MIKSKQSHKNQGLSVFSLASICSRAFFINAANCSSETSRGGTFNPLRTASRCAIVSCHFFSAGHSERSIPSMIGPPRTQPKLAMSAIVYLGPARYELSCRRDSSTEYSRLVSSI